MLAAREKDIKLAEEKKGKEEKGYLHKELCIYIREKYASNWREIPLHALANNLAKKTGLQIQNVSW